MQALDDARAGPDALVEETVTAARLRFSTEIVKRLGEELNPTLDKGVLELVKNAYDADATSCRVELRHTDQPGGTIIVEDNGDGMTAEQIADGWLVLGRSSKTTLRQTRLGRIPAGSKGLGRLAALRMGSTALLCTSPRSEHDSSHTLLIDWTEFDRAGIVDDFALDIETSSRAADLTRGTKVVIDDLNSGFGRVPVKHLARELIMLADPFDDNPTGFRPELLVSDYRDLELLVSNRYFDDAEFHLHADVLESGHAAATVLDWKGDLLYEAEHEEITKAKDHSPYRCPRATFDLWVFILNQRTFSSRRSSVRDVRAWLGEFGGVHFYYNGLRVTPYGNPGDDWLGINLRRAQSPEERPSTNTSIGRLTVLDQGDHLLQKTDRSGFIENDAFRQLRTFARDSLEWMAVRRLGDAERRRSETRAAAPKKTSIAKRRVEDAIAAVPEEGREAIQRAFDSYESSRDREVDVLQREVQLYRTLSTAGITAATFAHESNANPFKVISRSIAAIDRRVKKHTPDHYDSTFKRPIEGIKRALGSLSVLSTATLNLVDHEKRRPGRIDLHELVNDVLQTYSPFLAGRDVEVVCNLAPGSPYLRAQRAAIESILTNLLNNSMAAFEDGAVRRRVIEIASELVRDRWLLSVSDNGPGIQGISNSDIWLPGRTTRKHGTGLGLTIVRDATKDLGGSVGVVENGDLGGAVITVELPILGV